MVNADQEYAYPTQYKCRELNRGFTRFLEFYGSNGSAGYEDQEQTGCEVLRDYGGSGIVLNHIQETKEGDVYICHDPFAYMCEDRKLSQRWHAIAYLHPILAVQKGNPKNVKGLKDLLRDDLKIGLSHRKYSTRGKILWIMFRENGMAEETIKGRVRKRKGPSIAAMDLYP